MGVNKGSVGTIPSAKAACRGCHGRCVALRRDTAASQRPEQPRVRDRSSRCTAERKRDQSLVTHVRLLRSRCAAFFSATVASFWPSLLAITNRKNAHRTSVAAHTAAPARTTRAVSLSRCQRLEMRSGAHRRRGPWPGCARRRRCPPARAPPRTRRSRAPCASSSPCSAASCARKPRPITDARHGATLPARRGTHHCAGRMWK